MSPPLPNAKLLYFKMLLVFLFGMIVLEQLWHRNGMKMLRHRMRRIGMKYSRPSLQGISRDWRNLCLIGGLPYCHFDIIVQKSSLSNIQKTKMKSIYSYKIIIIHSHIFIFSLFHLYCDFSYFHDFGFQKFLTLHFTFDFYEQKLRKGKNY